MTSGGYDAFDDPYSYRGTDVLKNRLGTRNSSSCNAGGFGGSHVERFPLVAFFLPRAAAAEVLAIAEAADVGLDMTDGGLVRLYGQTDFDLHRFAENALARHHESEPSGEAP